jgi:hypothetical protein
MKRLIILTILISLILVGCISEPEEPEKIAVCLYKIKDIKPSKPIDIEVTEEDIIRATTTLVREGESLYLSIADIPLGVSDDISNMVFSSTTSKIVKAGDLIKFGEKIRCTEILNVDDWKELLPEPADDEVWKRVY